MVGYKVHFNGEKFVAESIESAIVDTPVDGVVDWFVGLDYALEAAENLDSHHKVNERQLNSDRDFLVRTCRECGGYFMLTSPRVEWFEQRELKLPCRCTACRKKRRAEKED